MTRAIVASDDQRKKEAAMLQVAEHHRNMLELDLAALLRLAQDMKMKEVIAEEGAHRAKEKFRKSMQENNQNFVHAVQKESEQALSKGAIQIDPIQPAHTDLAAVKDAIKKILEKIKEETKKEFKTFSQELKDALDQEQSNSPLTEKEKDNNRQVVDAFLGKIEKGIEDWEVQEVQEEDFKNWFGAYSHQLKPDPHTAAELVPDSSSEPQDVARRDLLIDSVRVQEQTPVAKVSPRPQPKASADNNNASQVSVLYGMSAPSPQNNVDTVKDLLRSILALASRSNPQETQELVQTVKSTLVKRALMNKEKIFRLITGDFQITGKSSYYNERNLNLLFNQHLTGQVAQSNQEKDDYAVIPEFRS